jgi:cytochrome c-type biogenesis protein CcmE
VAAVVTVFVVRPALRGNGVAEVTPSSLAGHSGTVVLTGMIVGRPYGYAYSKGGIRFGLRDINAATPARVLVVYHGSVPDLFKAGLHLALTGTLHNRLFVAEPGSLVTKDLVSYAPVTSSKT